MVGARMRPRNCTDTRSSYYPGSALLPASAGDMNTSTENFKSSRPCCCHKQEEQTESDVGSAELVETVHCSVLSEQLSSIVITSCDSSQLYTTDAAAACDISYTPDQHGNTHLHLAIMHGMTSMAEYLIRLAPNYQLLSLANSYRQTPLHLAVTAGQVAVVRQLVISGAEVTARDGRGNTPLHVACASRQTHCVQALTAPVLAAEQPCSTAVVVCRRPATVINLWNHQGMTCLHAAAVAGDLDIVSHLVNHGADVEAAEGCCGRTVLQLAVERGDMHMVMFLVRSCGAQLETCNYAGLSCYQLARQAGNWRLVQLLLQLGADQLPAASSDSDEAVMTGCSSAASSPGTD